MKLIKHTWTKKQTQQASVPNYGKKYVDQPNFLKLIGDVKNKKVLELGSGNGYWLKLLSKKGAQCVGVEISKNQIEKALSSGDDSIHYIQGDITKLNISSFFEKDYDVVFLNHVLLEISSRSKLQKIFKFSFDVLKEGGNLIISDLHPFAPLSKPYNIKVSKRFHYFSSGDIFKIVSKRIDGKEILYKDFHWTLSDIIQSMTKNGFLITDILEPRPTENQAKKYPNLRYRLKIPMAFMIKAVKINKECINKKHIA